MSSPTLIQKLTRPTCGKEVPELTYELEIEVRDRIVRAIQQKYPNWTQKTGVCAPCLNYFRHMVTRPGHFKRLKARLQDMLGRQHHQDEAP